MKRVFANDTRMPELDMMRIIGIILVVCGHVTRMFTAQGLIPMADESGVMKIITQVIYSFHMPLFVFVSGMTFALVSSKGNYQSFRLFVKKKAMRLLIPYFAFAILWVMPFMVGFGFRDLKSYFIDGICLSLDSRHLWYVWMLFNVFVLVYILRAMLYRVKLPQYSLLPISGIILVLEKVVGGRIPYFQIDNTLIFQFWFSLGYVVMLYKHSFKYLLPMLLVLVLLLSQIYVECIALFYALLGIISIYYLSIRLRFLTSFAIINKVSRNSFGIYLFHPVIIYFIFYYLNHSSIDIYLLAVGTIVISFIVSYYLTELMRKLRLQVLIGEKKQH